MTRRVIVIPPALPLSEAWKLMKGGRFRHLPVVENGVLVGIVSDRDVLRRSRDLDSDLEVPKVPTSQIMTPAPYVCSPDTHVADLVRIMTERKIDAVPVVTTDNRLVGLVTSTDLLLLLISLDEAKVPIPFDFELDSVAVSAYA